MKSKLRPVWHCMAVWHWMAGGARPDDAECLREIHRCLWDYYECKGNGLDVLASRHIDDAINICRKMREEL